jgi:hypothetical protein
MVFSETQRYGEHEEARVHKDPGLFIVVPYIRLPIRLVWPRRFFCHKAPMSHPLLMLLFDFLQLFNCLIPVFAVHISIGPTQRAPVLDIVPSHVTLLSSRLVASGILPQRLHNTRRELLVNGRDEETLERPTELMGLTKPRNMVARNGRQQQRADQTIQSKATVHLLSNRGFISILKRML